MLKKIRKIILVALFVFLAANSACAKEQLRQIALPLPSDLSAFKDIRVLVMKQKSQLQVTSAIPLRILDGRGQVVWKGQKAKDLLFQGIPGGVKVASLKAAFPMLHVKTSGEGIKINKKTVYGQNILIRADGEGKLQVITVLPIDDYLKGVVPFEANPKWTLASLEAQAVAARTFALFKMVERVNKPYDVSSGVFSQVYAGKHIENPKTNQAIDETHGEILTYKGKIFPGYFHSTCGGQTTAADLVWKVKGIRPLKGVECQYCKKSPHYRWRASFTPQEIKEKMASKGGIPVKEVKSITLDAIDETGRAHEMIIGSTWMEKTVDADAFRVWVGPEKLKSNLITRISPQEKEFIFKGRGWGHGVGMCQYGMKYLGELGYNYREILDFYYPGAQLVQLKG